MNIYYLKHAKYLIEYNLPLRKCIINATAQCSIHSQIPSCPQTEGGDELGLCGKEKTQP